MYLSEYLWMEQKLKTLTVSKVKRSTNVLLFCTKDMSPTIKRD